jgi:hypothetical protein
MGRARRYARLLEAIGGCTPHDKYAVHQRRAHHNNNYQNQEKKASALKDILHTPFTNSAPYNRRGISAPRRFLPIEYFYSSLSIQKL